LVASIKYREGRSSPGVDVPMSTDEISALDLWIETQSVPRPTRAEAIRQIVAQALRPPLVVARPSDASLDRQIAEQETVIAEMPERGSPSPQAAMDVMNKAMAENSLVDLKNRRTRRKNIRRERQKPPS